MRKNLLLVLIMLSVPFLLNGQFVLDDFDTIDTTIIHVDEGESAAQYLHLTTETTNVHGGSGALRVDWQNQCVSQWGGWINIAHTPEDSLGLYDFSLYTEFSIWYYVETPSSTTGEVDFRIILDDVGPDNNFADGGQEVWISQQSVFDAAPGWNQVVIPLVESESGSPTPDDGFASPGWSGTQNNDKLDLDKIRSWHIEWSQRGTFWEQPMDSVWGTILFDDAELQGIAPVNLIFFNGVNVPGSVNMHIGWSGAAEITDEEAFTAGTNSIKWSDAAAWDAVNFDLASARNMVNNWSTDSVQFKIKAEAGIGDLNLFFWDVDHDDGKDDYAFQATYTLTEASMVYDGTWKEVKIPLADFNRFAGVWDGDLGQSVSGEFDSTEVMGFAIGSNGQAFTGKVVYLDDIWTGSPVFDWEPPAEVTGVSAAPGDYYNLVYWTDVEGEEEESYNVYASESPITDVTSVGVEIIASGVTEGVESNTHYIYYPLQDKNVDYYYAVECIDAAGNVGVAGVSDVISNTGKAVPTIANHAPNGFAADGLFSDWDGIMSWELKPTINNIAAGEFVDGDDDLTATVWLAVDDTYMYVAVDAIDNAWFYDAANVGAWWTQDAFELYIGLWDKNGKPIHDLSPESSRGAEPDYKLIFLPDRFYNEYKNNHNGAASNPELEPTDDNYHYEEISGNWLLEAKIALDSIAFGDDAVFTPQNGMKVMFDLVFHDNDGSGWEGNLSWSTNNNDLAYLNQHEWTYTWIGDTTYVTSIDDDMGAVARGFDLEQNYPNPFNPSTTVAYTLEKHTQVQLDVFNVLGEKVAQLVNSKQQAGRHTIDFVADNMASGVYFYKLQAGDFVQVKKMLFVK